MDKERMEALKRLINGNDALIERILSVRQDAEEGGESARQYSEKVQQILKEAGIDCTAEEVEEFIEVNSAIELAPDDLEDVGGGCDTPVCHPICDRVFDREKCCEKHTRGGCVGVCADGSSSC